MLHIPFHSPWRGPFGLLLASLLTAGCAGSLPPPEVSFRDLPAGTPPAPCASIAGTYANWSPDEYSCAGHDFFACRSLTFHLLSRHVPEASGVSRLTTPADDWPTTANYVVIEQPTDGVVRILIHKSDIDPAQLVRELAAARGDFRCTAQGLELRPRAGADFVIGPTLYSGRSQRVENRWLRKSEGGDLIVTSERHYAAYMLGVANTGDRVEHRILQWPAVRLPPPP